jgi:hypothetical protein
MTTTRLRAALDALAAAVPDGREMLKNDPADFLLAVRVHLATAADTESRLRDEIRDLRLQVQALTGDLEDARRHGCECGEEEACRYVRERDKARALAARYREALERIAAIDYTRAATNLAAYDAHQIARAALTGRE